MKYFVIIFVLYPFMLLSQIKESQRSKGVIKEQYPLLEKAFEAKGLTFGNSVFLRIFKDEDVLEVWVKKGQSFELFKSYEICYFSGGLGPKRKQGDCKSPEGFYYAKPRDLNPYSSYHLSFNTGYPNAYDRSNGYTGSALMIHGNCVSIGCYAMTDERIEEIYSIIQKAFEKGQDLVRIHIFPFRVTNSNLVKHKDSEYILFWKNLKEGYDYFETHKTPPEISVKNKNYVLSL